MLGAEIKKRRFGVGEYHRMAEAGIFGEDDRLELADGEIVEMTPIGWRHVRAVTVLTQLLAGVLPGYYVSVQNPIGTPARSWLLLLATITAARPPGAVVIRAKIPILPSG